ncbi:ribonuclease H family protein [Levilactobacillus acidifarinae]|uniref:Ribonuclease H n=1 Tax=Levilactobacillus acidifarinae DSM 19394 = JCM 15949 TaxID=1423715 RepID=A0A0R1LED7_9LACO|nr:ribonuclease H family protein [Levilactobacillus acidifarinae]KRK94060.1 ribonuclease H [Levilactobacillus acidifarinae DSM 19394]GEO69774.1 ribonuclease H [Levilactobacillus acidifarinae]
MAQKFYAVRQGRQTGIYRTWPDAQKQVSGYPGAQYKSFPTEAAAQAFMAGTSTPTHATPGAAKVRATGSATPADITVYTDGGSRNTGNVAGGHVRNDDKAAWAYRMELPDQVVTDSAGEWGASNNRMEIMAFLRALQQLSRLGQATKSVQFVLDSRYVLNAVTQGWLAGWKRRGWKRSAGPLANAELWREVDQLLPQFSHLSFHWTKGHATNQGNVFVDHLLNQTMDHMTTPGVTPPAKGPVTTASPKAAPASVAPHPTQVAAQPASHQTVDRSVAAIRQILRDAGVSDDQ